jgi:hypothetical protein
MDNAQKSIILLIYHHHKFVDIIYAETIWQHIPKARTATVDSITFFFT